MADPSSVAQLFAAAKAKFGRVDVVFNNAGTGGAHKSIVDTTLAEMEATMAVNFGAVFLGLKYVIPAMRRAGGGQIANNGSPLSLPRPFVPPGPKSQSVPLPDHVFADRCNASHRPAARPGHGAFWPVRLGG